MSSFKVAAVIPQVCETYKETILHQLSTYPTTFDFAPESMSYNLLCCLPTASADTLNSRTRHILLLINRDKKKQKTQRSHQQKPACHSCSRSQKHPRKLTSAQSLHLLWRGRCRERSANNFNLQSLQHLRHNCVPRLLDYDDTIYMGGGNITERRRVNR